MKCYVTFGQVHRHEIGDKIIDRNCLVLLRFDHNDQNKAREKCFELFGDKFCFTYFDPKREKVEQLLRYFPRGVIELCS